ncbi:MAG TPA: hypothetical protein VFC31_16140 [Candidatus Limnocylindria bacterium]|nr:hypothetical protein [Candidatus Limnocylindria bacterium]
MSDERGQAAIMAVFLLAIAAVVMAGLRVAQSDLFVRAEVRRAGEAAVEAATAVVADAYAAEVRSRLAPSADPRPMDAAVSDPSLLEAARVVASDISLRNGGGVVPDVSARCADSMVEVAVYGGRYRATFAAAECSQR